MNAPLTIEALIDCIRESTRMVTVCAPSNDDSPWRPENWTSWSMAIVDPDGLIESLQKMMIRTPEHSPLESADTGPAAKVAKGANKQKAPTGFVKKITQIISEQLGVHKNFVTVVSRLEDFGIDSLDEIEIVMAIEDEFGVELLDEEIIHVRTVQDILDLPTLQKFK